MATLEVPGYNPANRDRLNAGCWAEGQDGRKLLVSGAGENFVAFVIHEYGTQVPNTMPLLEFQQSYSDGKWLWHDKTPWPQVA